MNNKEFIAKLAKQVGMKQNETLALAEKLVDVIVHELEEENLVSIHGFGSFEVKKKLERVVINPATKQRMLIPPKLTLSFKPSNTLKGKYKIQ